MSRSYVVNQLVDEIFESELSFYNNALKKLIASNAEAGGSVEGYYYFGKRFCLLKSCELTSKQLPTIHDDLLEDAQYVLDLAEKQERDRQKIKQSLAVVVSKCDSIQDVFDSLPQLFTSGIPTYQGYVRTKEPLFNFQDNTIFLNQFEKTVELTEYYLINRILS